MSRRERWRWRSCAAFCLASLAGCLVGAGAVGCGGESWEPASSAEGTDQKRPVGPLAERGKEKRRDRLLPLAAAEVAEFGIRVFTAGPATIDVRAELPGVVRANEDRLAHIVPRFAGIVTSVRKRIGDSVKSGEVLAIVESSRSLSPYALETLLDGVIIEKHVTRGEAVTPSTQAFVVADLETVWVDLSVYQRDLGRVREGQAARIMAGHGLPESEGVVSYVTPVVDDVTRTATARIVLENPLGFWRPGMFVTGEVSVARGQAEVAVPAAALHSVEGRPMVFVGVDGGFRPRVVKLGRRSPERVEILEGLAAGDEVVVEGGLTLKSDLMRGELAGSHGH